MADDFVTSYNNKVLADEQAREESEKNEAETKQHRVTAHQLFTHDGVKQVYVVDHDAGKVYIRGERGLLRYSGTNIEQVSNYPAYNEAETTPTQGYIKQVSDAGIVSYTDLQGQAYTPNDNDTEYFRNSSGLLVPLRSEPSTEGSADHSADDQLKQLGLKDTLQKAGVDQGPLTADKLVNPVTNQEGVTDATGQLQQQQNHPETENKTTEDLVQPAPGNKYQRHKSVNGQTYYTDAEGNKVVKADIPDTAEIEDIEDKE